jgi:CMP-N,N'-diacetyllegionaminic acid synthase
MKRVCTILARGGSKGLPGKNIRLLAGKPLIAHSIAQAKATDLFTAIVVSSDSPEILDAAGAAGADVLVTRPADMATDTAAKLPAICHAVLEAERTLKITHDVIVDLQPTSPTRLQADIEGAVHLLEAAFAGTVITGTEARCSPYFSLVERDANGTVRLAKPLNPSPVRRQDAPPTFDMNGSIYVWRREPFMTAPYIFDSATRLYEMPRERSIDIDDALDFELAALVMARR